MQRNSGPGAGVERLQARGTQEAFKAVWKNGKKTEVRRRIAIPSDLTLLECDSAAWSRNGYLMYVRSLEACLILWISLFQSSTRALDCALGRV